MEKVSAINAPSATLTMSTSGLTRSSNVAFDAYNANDAELISSQMEGMEIDSLSLSPDDFDAIAPPMPMPTIQAPQNVPRALLSHCNHVYCI